MLRKIGIATGKIVLFFVISLGLVVVYITAIAPQIGLPLTDKASGPAFDALQAVQLVAMVVTAAVLLALFDRKWVGDLGLGPRDLGDIVTGLIIGSFIFFVGLGAAFFAGVANIQLDVANFSLATCAAGVGIMLIAAGTEEVMMRGYVLQELMSKFSTATAVVVSSLIFVLLHANALVKDEVGIVGAANIFVASVLMSVAYLRTRALWLPIGIHAGWNATQGPLLGINVSGTDLGEGWHTVAFSGSKWMTGGAFGFEASVFGLIGPLLGAAMLLVFLRPQARPAAAAEHA